jgi:2-polyprenyl-3-methyl-5-hydroxy-6-metoxy-1,4-benzoquinol methylase
MNSSKSSDILLESLKGEKEYFDRLINERLKKGVPITSDIRNASFYEPKNINEELQDPGLAAIMLNPMRETIIRKICDSPNGKILDVCCGPGWFSLECARNGRDVLGLDISSKAISVAMQTFENNKNNLTGKAEYINESAEDFPIESIDYSAVNGWSGFHHLSDPGAFLDKVYEGLPKDGIVATFDDLDSGRTELFFRYLFKFIFPIYEYSYLEKIKFIFSVIVGRKILNKMLESPMEVYSDKHGNAAKVIRDKLVNKFIPIYDVEFAAFYVFVCMSIKGPKWFRYGSCYLIMFIDNLLCKVKICKPSYRVIISKK